MQIKKNVGGRGEEIARKRNLKSNAKHSTKYVKSKKEKMLYGSTTCDFQQLDCGRDYFNPQLRMKFHHGG